MLVLIALGAMLFFTGYEAGKASGTIERQKLEMKASDEAHQAFVDGVRTGANWTRHMIEKGGNE